MKFIISLFIFGLNFYLSAGPVNIIQESCLSCHKANSNIAPSFERISKQYSLSYSSRNIVKAYASFLQNPSVENVLLKDDYKKFGPMPFLVLSKKDIDEVAAFLAKADFKKLNKPIKKSNKTPKQVGKFYKSKMKSELGKNLLGAIKKNGTLGAVKFCNLEANNIAQRISKKYNANIKRVSDKPRNLENKANAKEQKYISLFKKQLKSNSLIPQLITTKDHYIYYTPIVTNQMCMQCHGQKDKEIDPIVYKQIEQYYPEDKAVNYRPKQIRGIFSIKWPKKKMN